MSNNPKYLLEVGNADQQRLEILHKIYSPFTIEFLKRSGLKEGMHVLEVGCGVGDMACLLAQTVGSKGKVTAIDISKEQLIIAEQKAKKCGIHNIEFKQCAVADLSQLNTSFDFAYAKWVLIFLKDPFEGLQTIYNCLKSGGILSCEDFSPSNTNIFSYPVSKVVRYFKNIIKKNFHQLGLDMHFGDKLYHHFKELSCQSVHIAFHQPVGLTPEEKSVIRLGFMSIKKTSLELGTLTENEIDNMIKEAELFEQEDAVLGFVRNILVSGKK